MTLIVEREGAESQKFSVNGGAAYEIGMRETDHGIPLEPYPDGEPVESAPPAGAERPA
jgi:hypothetical protein